MQIRLAGLAVAVAGIIVVALVWRSEIRAHVAERRILRDSARASELEAQTEWDALVAMMRADD